MLDPKLDMRNKIQLRWIAEMGIRMKKELFTLEKIVLVRNKRLIFNGFNLFLYEGDIYGIICDSIVERDALLNFFKGDCELQEGNIRYRRKGIKHGSAVPLLHSICTIIGKESKLIESLSIMENICIFADKSQMVHEKQYYEISRDLFERFGLTIQPEKSVLRLNNKERVAVELIKAYAEKKTIVVLADLSGFLQSNELEEIHRLVLQMQREQVSFLLFEAFDDILFRWTNQLLVVRGGKDLGCFDSRFIDRQKLYDFLVHKAVRSRGHVPAAVFEETEEMILQFEDVCTTHLQNLNFSVGKGEILKIYFLNTGSLEEFKGIFLDHGKRNSGRIILNGKPVTNCKISEWKKRGLCYSGELPYKNMLISDMTVRDNLMLSLSEKTKMLWMKTKYRRSVDQYIEENLGQDIAGRKLRNLPPEILQKLHYSCFYLYAPKVLVCEKPFTEVDLHIREVTMEMMAMLRDRGISLIVLITNLSDLNLLEGDNIYIKNGEMVDENEIYQSLYSE